MKWIEVPATRILEVATNELVEFELIDGNGDVIDVYVAYSFSMARRKRDGRLFRKSRLVPEDHNTSLFYLEEV